MGLEKNHLEENNGMDIDVLKLMEDFLEVIKQNRKVLSDPIRLERLLVEKEKKLVSARKRILASTNSQTLEKTLEEYEDLSNKYDEIIYKELIKRGLVGRRVLEKLLQDEEDAPTKEVSSVL
jgi:hypothetical protein